MKILIAIPAMDMCPVPFAYSLATLNRFCPSRISIISGAAVHEARDALAREAMDDGCDRVLFVDSDMAFESDMMQRLSAEMDAGYDMVCGIFTKRRLPVTPVIYRAIDAQAGEALPYFDYPENALFEVTACGFGAVMLSTDLLRRVEAAGNGLFAPLPKLSEDLSFCVRAREVGARIACDSTVKVGHVGLMTYGEHLYKRG